MWPQAATAVGTLSGALNTPHTGRFGFVSVTCVERLNDVFSITSSFLVQENKTYLSACYR